MASTISDSGTWTVLATDLTPMLEQNMAPRMELQKLNGLDFTDNFPFELDQFVKLMAAGLPAAQGLTGNLGYWATVNFIRDWLTAAVSFGVPSPIQP